MQDAKEEIRARLNIEDVIGEYVQLKRAGRNFKGLSPFSSEKTPSFYVSPDKNIWHDFSSNKGGDIFSFVMEFEGVDFRGAIEHLARKAGVDLSLYDNHAGGELAKRKKRLIEANELAANYYQQSLVRNPRAIEYVFKKRGLSKEIVQAFKIGYAPDSGEALIKFLIGRGFTKQELSAAGLTNRYGGDLFRGRMMVSLMDASGQVIGFTGRIIVDDPRAPKYLNTPQTLIYDKGRHVFGLSQAKESIRKLGYSVIVEGNLDVVSSHQVGITQVVATAGTAMTAHHLKALVRLSNKVRLAFDGDQAGLNATERAIPIGQEVGIELSIISMPDDAKDPDELIQHDPALWQSAIDNAQPAVDWVIKQYAHREDLKTAAGKRHFTTAALDVVRLLDDSVEREHYLKAISELSDSSVQALKEKLSDKTPEKAPVITQKKAKSLVDATEVIYGAEYNQDNLLAAALIDGSTHDLFRSLDSDIFIGEQRQAVVKYLASSGGKAVKDTPEALQKYDMYVKILLLRADARYADWNDQDRYFETARLIRQVATENKKKQKELLTDKLRQAEAEGDEPEANSMRGQLNKLIKEIQSGQR